jgi:CBS domain-containing protein
VTAEAEKEHVLEAIRTGVTDYVIKPLNYVALRHKLQAYCHEKARVPGLEMVVDKNVATILADAYIEDAVETLLRHATNSLPVINSQNRLVGLITEFQVLHAALSPDGNQRTVRDVMTKEVLTVTRETSLVAVLKVMEQRKVGQIPVVHDGQFIGVVTPAAILRHTRRTALLGADSRRGVLVGISAARVENIGEVEGVGITI